MLETQDVKRAFYALERNILIANISRAAIARATCRRALLVILIRRAIARATPIEHDHIARDHLGAVARLAFRILPLMRLQAAFDIDTAGLAQMLVADLGQLIPGAHIEPLGFLARIAVAIFPLATRRDTKGRDRAA